MGIDDRPPWRFTNALLREPATSTVDGLRSVDRGQPDLDTLKAEHKAYAGALARAGVSIEVLPPLEAYPDSMFVEDPALVFPDCAILLRPGASSRVGEAAELEPALAARFDAVHRLPAPGRVDGGDILVTPRRVYIGLSARTDAAGADALRSILADTGRAARIVEPPPGILHLKTACSLLDAETLLATGRMVDSGLFDDMKFVLVPDGEEAAANALRVNEVMLVAAGFPGTRSGVAAAGLQVETVPVAEVGKLDAGLSCMSLRW